MFCLFASSYNSSLALHIACHHRRPPNLKSHCRGNESVYLFITTTTHDTCGDHFSVQADVLSVYDKMGCFLGNVKSI